MQRWDFGLIAKPGIGIDRPRELAEQINALCEGSYAIYDSDRGMFGTEYYEIDGDGLAKLV